MFSILLLEPSLTDAVRVFVDRTLAYQLDRDSPFSPWDWGQYHARGIPDLRPLQLILQLAVLALAGVVAVIPQRKGPLELAALSAAVLVGFELDADPLVVSLHPVVPAVRPARAAPAAARAVR